MSILSILLSLESGYHNPPLEDRRPHRSTPSQKRPRLTTFVLAYARTSPLNHVYMYSTDIRVSYVQLAAYV
jgi:hypothetical protein